MQTTLLTQRTQTYPMCNDPQQSWACKRKYPRSFKLDTTVRGTFDRTHNFFIRSVSGAPTHYNPFGFWRTNISLCVWNARRNSATQLKRPKFASQPIQYTCNHGAGPPNCTNLCWQLQPQSPEPSDPSAISTPPLNLSTIEGWETPHTTFDNNTFYSDEEPSRIYFLPSSPSPPPPPRKLRRKMSSAIFFPKRRGVSQHLFEACNKTLPTKKFSLTLYRPK